MPSRPGIAARRYPALHCWASPAVIVPTGKYQLAVAPSLHHMVRHMRQHDPRPPWHLEPLWSNRK